MTAVVLPARPRARPSRPRPSTQPARPQLRLLDVPERARGRARSIAVLSSVAVLAVFTIVAFHALTAQSQVAVDRLERETSVAERQYERARYEHASLASPERIVRRAADLGLVPPAGPPTAIPVEGELPTPPEGTSGTLHGWTEVKPTLVDAP